MSECQWKADMPVSQSTMELPKKKDGQVDWHTLGNILTAHALGEVVCASYVDSKFGNCQDNLLPETNWRYAFEEKDVIVFVKDLEDSPLKCFMGRSVIDLPVKVVHECISISENALHWDKYAVESRVIECFREEEDICDGINYLKCEAKYCLLRSKRDFLFYVRNQHMPETGKCVVSSLSVDYQSFPPVPGISRGQVGLGSGWVLEPFNGDTSRTLVSYLVHANLSGVPSLIINRVMRRQPLNIHYLRRYLTKPPLPPSSSSSSATATAATTAAAAGKASFSSKPQNSSNTASSVAGGCADFSVVTPEIPTPDVFHDQTGYTFSAVTLGSNPLYNNWSISSAATAKDKNIASLSDNGDREDDGEMQNSVKPPEEGESVLDFRITSMEGGGGGGGGGKKRPGYLWLPSLERLKPEQSLPKISPSESNSTHVPPLDLQHR